MNTHQFLLLLLTVKAVKAQNFNDLNKRDTFAGPTLQKQLEHESRNAQCCVKKMRCCKKQPAPPNIEIRAVMARCTNPPTSCMKRRKVTKPMYQANSERLTKFQGFDEDEPLVQSEVTKCNKKLILTMKIKNDGETNTRSQFIVIDHVYDPISAMTVRILNPYVIKMKQDHVSQTYPLKFLDFVNSEAREQVYNKHDGNFTGCCMDDKKPTCGLIKYQSKIIPYSGGFCCSCDAQKNAERQPDSEPVEPRIGASDPAYLMDAVQCPRTDIHEKFLNEKSTHGKRQKNNDNNLYYMKHQSDVDGRIMYNEYKAKIMREALNSDMKDDEQFMNSFQNSFRPDHGINYKIQAMNDEYEDDRQAKPFNSDEVAQIGKFHDKKHRREEKSTENHQTQPQKAKQIHTKKITTSQPKPNELSIHKLSDINDSDLPSSTLDDQEFKDDHVHSLSYQTSTSKNAQYEELNENGPSVEDEDVNLLENIYSKRQVQSSGVQRRGGQNCADRYTPPHLNPETYHESAHCLRFSPVWYGVYKIEKPIVEQEIVIQIFEKYETESGLIRWKDITNGKKIRLGTFSPYYKDETPTISLTFNSMYNDEDFCIEWKKLRLLIPEGLRVSELLKYSEAKGGPSEYLVVNAERIILSGEQCDVVGVGFEAFFKQRNRCSMQRGTCLRHQPKNMWLHDKKRERLGKKGCYFLKYHGKLSKNPIRKNITTDERFLTLNYFGKYISIIDLEINADFNAVLRPSSTGVITEVYVDSTYPSRTHITIKLTNGGLLSSKFMVRICDCPLDLKGQLNNLKSDLVLIAPQNQHIFKLTVYNKLEVDIFHCSVEALNSKGELVALRRIRIQKLDRCICTWHCLCACIGSTKGLKCVPLKLDHYHAAGFRGGLPTTLYTEHDMSADDVMRITFYLVIFIFITLLLLGLTKGLIGLCCLPIGSWGLNLLLDLPKPMKSYYEPSLNDRKVIYDGEGWPIHPDTKENVRNLPAAAEFCANVLFFYTYPTVILLLLVRRICCPGLDQRSRGVFFRRQVCNARCRTSNAQADSGTDSTVSDRAKKKPCTTCDWTKKTSDVGDKKKPTIKLSIKEHSKQKTKTPTSPKSVDKHESYFSSTESTTGTSSKT